MEKGCNKEKEGQNQLVFYITKLLLYKIRFYSRLVNLNKGLYTSLPTKSTFKIIIKLN